MKFFKGTPAYSLAQAIERDDPTLVESLVREKPSLLEVRDSVCCMTVLDLSISLGTYKAFAKLMELGADPNGINPTTKESPLMSSIVYRDGMFQSYVDTRFPELLLQKGADPNYAIDSKFVDSSGVTYLADSPIHIACWHDIEYVKLLIRYGANPNKKLEHSETPLGKAADFHKYEIVTYLIDSCNVNVFEPVYISYRLPEERVLTWYIQNMLLNRHDYLIALVKGEDTKAAEILKKHPDIYRGTKEFWELVDKLKRMGVDFKNHEYF